MCSTSPPDPTSLNGNACERRGPDGSYEPTGTRISDQLPTSVMLLAGPRLTFPPQQVRGEFEHRELNGDGNLWRHVQVEIVSRAQVCEFSEHELFAIRLALEEALVNAIKHGNGCDPTKTVHIEYSVNRWETRIRITDEGPGFDPEAVPDPTLPEFLERPSGRGLLLMRYYMCGLQFNDTGNSVEMWKYRRAATPRGCNSMNGRTATCHPRPWATPRELTNHIVAVHHECRRLSLRHLDGLIARIVRERIVSPGLMDRLAREFTALTEVLETHMAKQECWLFRMIRQLREPVGDVAWAYQVETGLDKLLDQLAHENQEALTLMEQVLICLSDRGWARKGPLVDELVVDTRELGDDLVEHIRLETDVLFPWVREMLPTHCLAL